MPGCGRSRVRSHPVGLRSSTPIPPSRTDRRPGFRCCIRPSRRRGPTPRRCVCRSSPTCISTAMGPSSPTRSAVSHGRGSNGLYNAWFGEYLATKSYLIAMIDNHRDEQLRSHGAVLLQQALAAAPRHQHDCHGAAPGRCGGAAHRPRQDRRRRPFPGSASPGSTPTGSWPSSAAGPTTRCCRLRFVPRCRSTPGRPWTCTTRA